MIPQTTLTALEFNKLLEIIAQHAKSDASRSAILSIKPLSSRNEIEKRFACIKEIRRMSQDARPLTILSFADIAPILEKTVPEHAILEPLELVGITDFLHAIHEAVSQIRRSERPFAPTALHELTQNILSRTELLQSLRSAVDAEGNILDSASPHLAELRSEKRRLENKIKRQLEKIIQDEQTAVFLQDTFITQRSGRWVIPVRMDSKGQVPGVAHDVSRTGETAFIEPMAVIGLSNEYENIIADEKAEVMRILRELAARVREAADGLESEFRILVYLDMLRSISVVADELKMHVPDISDNNVIHLSNARHPLLLHAAIQKNKAPDIVPIDARLGGDKTVMIITGPNAGGKTVALKTIGLLSVMALSGMPVSAGEATTIPFFKNLLVDIGDRQSIADHLSTFTAHLSNMMEFLNKADSATLILIDEMGTGTDPEEGAALACAILKELRGKGSLVFATTHLTDIKVFAHRETALVNASMEFDRKTFAPLYKLRAGEPGQSFALETAERYGLPQKIIESARNMLGKKRAELEHLIHDLDQKRKEHEEMVELLEKQKSELKAKEEQIDNLLRDTEAQKKAALAAAYEEASEIVSGIKRKMQAIFEEMKKREKIVGTRHVAPLIKEAATAQEEISQKIKEYEEAEAEQVSVDDLKEGDTVFVKSLGHDASIVKIFKKKNRIKVKAGSFEMEVAINDVGKNRGKEIESSRTGVRMLHAEETAASRINMIGMRVDEALPKLEKFLNDAALAGLSEVVVIHGIGAGILSKAVREYISGHPLVKDFRSGEQFEGGGGVTVVVLK